MLYNYQNKKRTYCKCIGVDGNEYIVRQDALISGATHTIHGACTGGKKHDITNQKFGRLLAIEPTENRASNGNIRWKCLCDCGNYTYPTMNNLKRGHTTSCGCAKVDFIESCKIDIINKKFGYLTVISELISPNNKRRKVKCLCDCGKEHICSVTDLTTGHTQSCGCKKTSNGESIVGELLKKYKISYIPQKTFPDCKNVRLLHFDFYLDKCNTCIEYDGMQHFKPIDYFGGEEHFKRTQRNDLIKEEYCIANNIELIRIPYTTKNKEIEKIIKNLVNPATTTVV